MHKAIFFFLKSCLNILLTNFSHYHINQQLKYISIPPPTLLHLTLIFLGSKIIAVVTATTKLKYTCSLEE